VDLGLQVAIELHVMTLDFLHNWTEYFAAFLHSEPK